MIRAKQFLIQNISFSFFKSYGLLFLIGILHFQVPAFAQFKSVTVSGKIIDKENKQALSFVNIVIKKASDSSFVAGSVANEDGRFTLQGISPNPYQIEFSAIGYSTLKQVLYIGSLSEFIAIPTVSLARNNITLQELNIQGNQEGISNKMDRKTFVVDNNISQIGGSVLQVMQNLPGVTVQDGKIQLRGNDKVIVLIDGKQTALTGMGSQTGLDNLPASAIEKIEIINHPSAKYDANGNAGIVNIVYKKNKKTGFNGKAGLAGGLGALWVRKENLPNIYPQYQNTPKINPSISLNYLKNKVNWYFQGDYLYTEKLNKNEFVNRTYSDGTIINQQTKRNRITHFVTSKMGMDWNLNSQNQFSISTLFGTERIIDHGDEPFFNSDLSSRLRLWQFLEDELKTTAMASANFQHKFEEPGHTLNMGLNFSFHREDEKYFFDNIMPTFTGKDAFKLLSDEWVADANIDYVKPLKYGRIESGLKFRRREIPTNMQFIPGLNSPLDSTAGGPATYKEIIPALYGNYVFENKYYEAELGLRMEYVNINYIVGSAHPVYQSDGYNYTQPFPSLRLAYKMNANSKITLFYNRRVDRPNEGDIRVFPKYDDAEIVRVGNPALKPQYTNTLEIGFKQNWSKASFYATAYQKRVDGTMTRIATTKPGSNIIYTVFQNAKGSSQTGMEMLLSLEPSKWFGLNFNVNAYYNSIDAFTIENKYPVSSIYSADQQTIYSGNAKLNCLFQTKRNLSIQTSIIYLAPDLIPQGKMAERYSLDIGMKKSIQKGKAELFINATDIANTLVMSKRIQGKDFFYTTSDYLETQVFRIGYNTKF